MKYFLDTNVLVAACIADHEHHARALPVVQAIHDRKADGFVSGHSLLEALAILTRLPRVPRITSTQAAAMIEANVASHFTVVALTGKEYSDLVARLGRDNIIGGAVYDALHLACAEKAAAHRIYTFNCQHFRDLAPHLAERITAP